MTVYVISKKGYRVKFKTGTKKLIGIIAGCDFSGALGYDFHTDDAQDDNGTFCKYILEQGIERIGEETTNG